MRSSTGNLSGSKSIPRNSFTNRTAYFIKVNVFRPKKSIFSKPADSATELSYCVQTITESLAVATGTKFVKSSGVIITPHACIPVFLTDPSMSFARFRTAAKRSFPSAIFRNSLAEFKSSWFNLNLSANSKSVNENNFFKEISGTSFAKRSASCNGKSITRAVSRMADFAAIVP